MKKTYMRPATMVVAIKTTGVILSASGVSGSDGYDIGYGGTDEDGSQDPATRRRRPTVWDDAEEEKEEGGW